MLRKLENQPSLTISEMQESFFDKWFRYVKSDGAKRALYIADTWEELNSVTPQQMKEEGYIYWGDICPAHLMPTDTQIGGIESDTIPPMH